MQLPDLAFTVQPPVESGRTRDYIGKDDHLVATGSTELSVLYRYRAPLLGLHIGGLVGFVCLSWPVTAALALGSVYQT